MLDRGGINSIIRLIHTIVNEKLLHYSRGSGGTGAPPIPPEVMKGHPLDPDAGPHTGTLPEDEVGFDDGGGHDHQGEGSTGKKVSTDSVLITLTNRTGGQRTVGDVVVTDPDNDESFIGTSGSPGYQGKVVVVAETIDTSGSGPCWERGGPFEIEVVGAVDRNDGLRTSATIYKAEAAASVVSDGVFAIALSTSGSGGGTIKAVFLDVISEGGGGAANHNVLDADVHPDTVAQAVTRGSMIVGSATPKWTELVIGAAARYLRSDGTDLAYAQIPASEVVNTPAGGIAATDVQATLNELDTEKAGIADAETISADWLFSARLTANQKFTLGSPTELTIAGSVITATKSYHRIDTEADAAVDDLDTINGGADGMLLVLGMAWSTRTPTLKDGTGNLALAGDFALDNLRDRIVLQYDAGLSLWMELSRSNNQ